MYWNHNRDSSRLLPQKTSQVSISDVYNNVWLGLLKRNVNWACHLPTIVGATIYPGIPPCHIVKFLQHIWRSVHELWIHLPLGSVITQSNTTRYCIEHHRDLGRAYTYLRLWNHQRYPSHSLDWTVGCPYLEVIDVFIVLLCNPVINCDIFRDVVVWMWKFAVKLLVWSCYLHFRLPLMSNNHLIGFTVTCWSTAVLG